MTWRLGFDIGSTYSKAVLLEGGRLLGWEVARSGHDYRSTAEAIGGRLLEAQGLRPEDVQVSASTGTGSAHLRRAAHAGSDLVCTARGVAHLFPGARAAIDVGGQSAKALLVGPGGRLARFAVSERCATGSGRFVEVIARVLQVELDEFGAVSLESDAPIALTTACAVFGESEVITRIAQGASRRDIAAGVHRSIAAKIGALAKKIRLPGPCVACGGGALNAGLVKAIREEVPVELLVPEQPQLVAAMGAALTGPGGGRGSGMEQV